MAATLVIFGASGDLTKRKLVPALYSLEAEGLLPDALEVIGVGRSPLADEAFRDAMRDSCDLFARRKPVLPAVWGRFAPRLSYYQGDVTDLSSMERLRRFLEQKEAARSGGQGGAATLRDGGDRATGGVTAGDRLFYLAIPPDAYPVALSVLGVSGLVARARAGSRRAPAVSVASRPAHRVVVEKPFGRDLESARNLNAVAMSVLREDQLYRIDHYLGKETVQNLLAFRFGNSIWEPLWNRSHIDHVQLTAAETIGMEGRGAFYESAGILRDMVQNHLLQILSLVAMERPASTAADAVRRQKAKVLGSLRPMTAEDVRRWTVRAQYGPGHGPGPGGQEGQDIPGYRQEPGVAPDSQVPTFAAMRLFFDNRRWRGVPFYLRAGKRLAAKVTEVSVFFRQTSRLSFGSTAKAPNVLTFRIQPDESLSLHVAVKVPGEPLGVAGKDMTFRYQGAFPKELPEAYETLLLDALRGEARLFVSWDEVEAAWKFITPILDAWDKQPPSTLVSYTPGSWGPTAADIPVKNEGHECRNLS